MRQIHAVKPKTPLAIAVEALVKLQVHIAVLTQLAERTKDRELFSQAVAMYNACEQAIHDAKGRH